MDGSLFNISVLSCLIKFINIIDDAIAVKKMLFSSVCVIFTEAYALQFIH
jgi:hypothetical protein